MAFIFKNDLEKIEGDDIVKYYSISERNLDDEYKKELSLTKLKFKNRIKQNKLEKEKIVTERKELKKNIYELEIREKNIMNKNTNKELYIFWGSLMCLMYFSFLFINTYIIKSKNVTIGVFQELLTIPFMLGSLVLLFFALKCCISSKFSLRNYSLYSIFILTIIIAITWGSFMF